MGSPGQVVRQPAPRSRSTLPNVVLSWSASSSSNVIGYLIRYGNTSGNYRLIARAVYDTGSTVDSAPVTISVNALLPPWQSMDLGAVGTVGNRSITMATNVCIGLVVASGSTNTPITSLFSSVSVVP